MTGQFYGKVGSYGPYVADHRRTSFHLIHYDGQNPFSLLEAEQESFARTPAHIEPVHSLIQKNVYESPQGFLMDPAFLVKGSQQSRKDAR